KRALLAERRDALLGAEVAATLDTLRQREEERPALAASEALLALARLGRDDVGFEALAHPEQRTELLEGLARAGEADALQALATLALAVAGTEEERGEAFFFQAIGQALGG